WRLRSNKVDAVWDMVSLRTGSSGLLCSPISGTTGSPGTTFPRALSGGFRQSAGSRGIFILHRDGCVDEAIRADPSRESDEVGMADDSVGDIDAKAVARIAFAALGHEDQIPGTV